MSQTSSKVNGQVALLNNVAIAAVCMERIINADSDMPKIGLLTGKAGFGKSSAACYLVNKYHAYRIECKSVWNRKTVLTQLLFVMGIKAAGTMPEMLDQVCAQLMASGRPLIIDEMDHLVNKSAVEIVRDIHDGSGNGPILLIGEEEMPKKLQRWERVDSRILEAAQVQPLDLEDAQLLADFYCNRVEISSDLLAHVHSKSGGSARRIRVNLNLIEETALRMGLTAIDLSIWGNQPLYVRGAK